MKLRVLGLFYIIASTLCACSIKPSINQEPSIILPPTEIEPGQHSSKDGSDIVEDTKGPDKDESNIIQTLDAGDKVLWSYLSLDDSKSIVFSPYSIRACIGTLYNSMSDSLQNDVYNVLNITQTELNAMQNVNSIERSNVLNVNNKIYINKTFESIANKNCLNNNIEFAVMSNDTRKEINKEIENNTNGKIKNLIPSGTLSDSTSMIAADSIYFNDSWKNPLYYDTKLDWTGYNKKTVKKDGFTGTINVDNIQEPTPDIDVTSIDYKTSGLSFILFSKSENADENVRVVDFINNLSNAELHELCKNNKNISTEYDNADFVIPNFEIESDVSTIPEALISAGLPDLFNGEKQPFEKLNIPNLALSGILHKAYIKVDKYGTEAAAATMAEMKTTALAKEAQNTKHIIADEPFAFAIFDKINDQIIFMGSVTAL